MTNEAIKLAYNACNNWLSATGGERFKGALKYMHDAALETLANQEFVRGETVIFDGQSKFQVLVTDDESTDESFFCGTIISAGTSAWPVGHHSDRWIRSEFCRP